MPMLKDNELIGVIAIYRRDVRPFTEKQIELGSKLIKSTIQERRRGSKTRGSGQPVVSRGDASEVLQPVERTLDMPTQFVEALAEAEWLLSVAAVGNDRLGPALVQVFAQLGAVIRLVAEQAFW